MTEKKTKMETLEMFIKAQNRDYYFKGIGASVNKSNITIISEGEQVPIQE